MHLLKIATMTSVPMLLLVSLLIKLIVIGLYSIIGTGICLRNVTGIDDVSLLTFQRSFSPT